MLEWVWYVSISTVYYHVRLDAYELTSGPRSSTADTIMHSSQEKLTLDICSCRRNGCS